MRKQIEKPGAPPSASARRVSAAWKLLPLALLAAVLAPFAHAQLLGEPPIPPKNKKEKKRPADLEWLYQYSPPPAEGRENELLQDPHFQPFLAQYFTAPQSFWGPNPTDPKAPTHKSLAETAYDFLAVPGTVSLDDNRYLIATGAVRRFPASRGLLFADLNTGDPLVVFAAIDWIRDSRPLDDPAAEYTLWIFPSKAPGTPQTPSTLPPPLARALARWAALPLARNQVVQHVTHAILVDPDGTPHEIPVPALAPAPAEAQPLPKRR